jgi:hypothetical protein
MTEREPISWEEEEERLASESLAAGDPTGWFDRLYAAGATGHVQMPWSRVQPHPPDPPRRQAITNVSRLVGPGGTLLVIAAVHDDSAPPSPLPPWPLRREEIEAFAADGLDPVRVEIVTVPGRPTEHRWRAEFHRRPGPC